MGDDMYNIVPVVGRLLDDNESYFILAHFIPPSRAS